MQNIQSNIFNSYGEKGHQLPICCRFKSKTWLNLPPIYKEKVRKLINSLEIGTSFLALGGKKIKCNDSLIRFRIGRSHRLLLRTKPSERELVLLERQSYESFFRRRH